MSVSSICDQAPILPASLKGDGGARQNSTQKWRAPGEKRRIFRLIEAKLDPAVQRAPKNLGKFGGASNWCGARRGRKSQKRLNFLIDFALQRASLLAESGTVGQETRGKCHSEVDLAALGEVG